MARKDRHHQTPSQTSGKDVVTVVAQYNVLGIPDGGGGGVVHCVDPVVWTPQGMFSSVTLTWVLSVCAPLSGIEATSPEGMSPHLCALEGFFSCSKCSLKAGDRGSS